jgi:hypothetical protein
MATEQFIQRGRHKSGFAVLSNKIWEDDKLSIEAKGTLGYLLSRPANWRVRLTQVAKKLKIGRDRLYRIVHECIEAGYIERRQGRKGGAFRSVSYFVNDVASLSHTDLPEAAQPEAAQPEAANQEALIRKNSNKEDSEQIISASPPAPPPRRAREGDAAAERALASLSVSKRAHPGWRGLGAWIDRLLCDGVEQADIVVGIAQCLKSLKDEPPSTFGYFNAAIERAREARLRPLPVVRAVPGADQHQLGAGGDALRKRLGDDVFAAWFSRAKLVGVAEGTVIIAVATTFMKSHIVAHFETQCVQAFSLVNPSVVRVDVVVQSGGDGGADV